MRDQTVATFSGPVEAHTVGIDSLMPADSPRLTEDDAHARLLAESEAPLPPILVHRETMRVIDGMHRLKAAALKGQREISVVYFDGSKEDAFVRAVEENITHGLPLSLSDRKAAAVRIMSSHPQLSDRAIAARTGLASKTIATLRHRSTAEAPQLNTRVGSDGRLRPVNGQEGRKRASEAIAARPDASLREIARIAGVSVGTAHDVRKRIRLGEDPLPPAQQAPRRPQEISASPGQVNLTGRGGRPGMQSADRVVALEKLMRDPALRHTDLGRELLRLLHMRAIATEDWSDLIDAIPPHCAEAVAKVALHCAESWIQFARELERRGGFIR